ncbi:ABC transporter permease [Kiloniella laminariae]|uniref:Transport permease protein n=1 Tax=Kiloniella laminariae TaxID=454162 RepID=A0ABT4LIM1_9PROT|nr:ABC transporter permease [Kiloniella laminariae]MCZ4280958.1 ABC transporter permease [Kiloniella laminariae]
MSDSLQIGTRSSDTAVRVIRKDSSLMRVQAVLLRHLYLMRASWPRIFELMYWPSIQIVIWGFFTQFLLTNSSYVAQAAGVLVSAVLLWDVLFRAQLGFSLSFLEELWSRNIGNLAVSPLRPIEFLGSLMIMSAFRTLIGILPATFIAILFYEVSIYELGLPLVLFFSNLMIMGWSIGLMVCALILRVGLGAESMAWLTIFLIAPVSAIYYPVDILPGWLQSIAWCLPTAPVFEGMRAILFHQGFSLELYLHSLGLNAIYLAIAMGLFIWSYHVARKRGLLLQIGE